MKIRCEVAYARPAQQTLVALEVESGTTIAQAIQLSDLLRRFPEINLAVQAVGVFAKRRELTDKVCEGDRIEIYRPLLIDPKEARRSKAKCLARKKETSLA